MTYDPLDGTVAGAQPDSLRLTPKRPAFYARAAAGVQQKIMTTYGFTPAMVEAPSAWLRDLEPAITTQLNQDAWFATRDEAIQRSGAPLATPKGHDAIETAARAIIHRYIDAACIGKPLLESDDSSIPESNRSFFRYENVRLNLFDIYKNHVCNQAEAELRELGLNRASAHALNGALIIRSARIYSRLEEGGIGGVVPLKEEAKIRPAQGSMKGLSPTRGTAG